MKTYILHIFLSFSVAISAQIGGTKAFRFLDLPVPARSNALGGASISIFDDDINLAYGNPALLNTACNKQLAFNYVNFVSDVNYGNFAYARIIPKYGVIGIGLQFFNYGKFDGRDEYDEKTRTFRAADYSLNLSFAKPINKDSSLTIGTTLKTIFSQYDTYSSLGNAIDVGLTYHNKKQLAISLVAKNYGRQWKTYSNNSVSEKLPSDLQLGFSKKVAKAPFRIIVQYDQLLKWNLTYSDPSESTNEDPFATKTAVKTQKQKRNEAISATLDKFSRHLILGTEIIFTKSLNLRVAYNFRKGKEMNLPDRRAVNGLSLGFGFKIKRFHLDYAYSKYALTGNSHTFGITTNLGLFTKK